MLAEDPELQNGYNAIGFSQVNYLFLNLQSKNMLRLMEKFTEKSANHKTKTDNVNVLREDNSSELLPKDVPNLQ